MRDTLETRLGIFVALAVIAAVLILETVGGVEQFRRGVRVRALFTTVQDLKVGDRVKMAGVEIGRIERIDLTNNQVSVTMKIIRNRIANVKTDSIAAVKYTGLLGQNFVSLDFGKPGSPPATEGTVLESKEQPDLSAVMQKIDSVASGVQKMTESFTGFRIDDLLGPLTDFVRANKDPLTATISNVQNISSQVAQGQGTVGKLIYDKSLYNTALATVSNFQDTASQIQLTVADARKVVDEIEAGQGTVGKLLKDDTLYRETTASMTNLHGILQKINQGEGSVGKIVNDREFYNNAKLTLQKLDKATEGLEDQGPLSVMGILINQFF